MRKVVGYLLMTLDGVVAAGDWVEDFDEGMRDNMVAVIDAQDAVLLGRVTYQQWASYWPTATDEPAFARFINAAPKYVVTTTLQDVDAWQPATLITGNISQAIAQLRQQPGRDIGVHGSLTLVRSLLAADLLDELILVVYPIMVGGGRRLLQAGDDFKRLKLVNSTSTSTGGLILTYQPLRP